MTTPLVVTAASVAAVYAAGRVLTAFAERRPPARHYLAGRHDDVRIADLVVCGEELLVTFVTEPSVGLTLRIWSAVNQPSSRQRLDRWRREATPLRAYLSTDGAIMLADPVWGGNVACEPSMVLN